ncbi:hypothetical protein [Frigoribacterium sp. CFBP 13712]|uniref:hypothetical protein n=1 Tax=Frigoribacterium sp. CFBP 13712 TaxID=2775309 RepID=UPI00178043B0|nr:hypothetical protein [Frigoribacterium sp. CFBP 13712]MBD8703028.1 hypothetical protein [Frigoribacterium sp. CFBP 13712]
MTPAAHHENQIIAVLQGGPFDGQEHEIDVVDGSIQDTLSLPQTDTEVLANYSREDSRVDDDGVQRIDFRFIEDTYS